MLWISIVFDADPDPTFQSADPNPDQASDPDSDPDPSTSCTQVGISEIVMTLYTAMPINIVLSFTSGHIKRFRNSYQYRYNIKRCSSFYSIRNDCKWCLKPGIGTALN
jgi:hypothetical protein